MKHAEFWQRVKQLCVEIRCRKNCTTVRRLVDVTKQTNIALPIRRRLRLTNVNLAIRPFLRGALGTLVIIIGIPTVALLLLAAISRFGKRGGGGGGGCGAGSGCGGGCGGCGG